MVKLTQIIRRFEGLALKGFNINNNWQFWKEKLYTHFLIVLLDISHFSLQVQKLLYDGEEDEGTFNKFADNSKMKEFLIQHFDLKVVELCQHFANVLDTLKCELGNTQETHEVTELLNK